MFEIPNNKKGIIDHLFLIFYVYICKIDSNIIF